MDKDRLDRILEVMSRLDETAKTGSDLKDRLSQLCGKDKSLRQSIERLLESGNLPGNFLEGDGAALAMSLLAKEPSELGHVFGNYRAIEELGSGGMGRVLLGQHLDESIEKEVAIKVIKRGKDTDEIIRRFKIEQRILGKLEHRNIASLHDVGTTADGRAYFIMERALGVPIDVYCDGERLTITERIRLFQTVCEAVRFAHQKAVVHRDIKPSNILVKDGIPKLLDFGIAKLLTAEKTFTATGPGNSPMTPSYASPEQINGEPLDTRSDIYALGVLLYELLTGRLPYLFKTQNLEGYRRAINEAVIEPPSKAVRRVGWKKGRQDVVEMAIAPEEISHLRRRTPRTLTGDFRRGLDGITLKALAKAPDNRYESVDALSQDLSKYLSNLPVSASPPSWVHDAWLFVKRHKVPVSFASLVILGLVALSVSVYVESQRTEQQRQRAEYIGEFMSGLFIAANPLENPEERLGFDRRPDEVTAVDLLERGVERLSEVRADQPDLYVHLATVIGGSFHGLGQISRSTEILESALVEVRKDSFQPSTSRHGALLTMLGNVYLSQEKIDKAIETLEEARSVFEQLAEGAREELLVGCLDALANAYMAKRDQESARALFDRILQLIEQPSAVSPALRSTVLNSIGILHLEDQDYANAETRFRESLALADRKQTYKVNVVNNLAVALHGQRRDEETLALLREVIEKNESQLGSEHINLVSALGNLANFLSDMGRDDEAAAGTRRSIDILVSNFGEVHLMVAQARDFLGQILLRSGRFDEARAEHEAALEIRQKLPHEHSELAESYMNLAILHDAGLSMPDEAESYYIKAYELRKVRLPGSRLLAMSSLRLGEFYAGRGRPEEAIPLLEEAVNLVEAQLGPNHHDVGKGLSDLADTYGRVGRLDEAEETCERAVSILSNTSPMHWQYAESLVVLARIRSEQGELGKALDLSTKALAVVKGVPTQNHQFFARLLYYRGAVFWELKRFGESRRAFDEALTVQRDFFGDEHPSTLQMRAEIAKSYSKE